MKNPLKKLEDMKEVRIGKTKIAVGVLVFIALLLLALWQFGFFDYDLGEGAGNEQDGFQGAIRIREVINGEDLVAPVRALEPQTIKRWWLTTWKSMGGEMITGGKMVVLTKGYESETQNPSQQYENYYGTVDGNSHGLEITMNYYYLPKQDPWSIDVIDGGWGNWDRLKIPMGSVVLYDDWATWMKVDEASNGADPDGSSAFVTGVFDSGDDMWLGNSPDPSDIKSGFRWGVTSGSPTTDRSSMLGDYPEAGGVNYICILPHRDRPAPPLWSDRDINTLYDAFPEPAGWWSSPVTDVTRYNFFSPFENRWHWTTPGGGVGWFDLGNPNSANRWPILYFMLDEDCPLWEEAVDTNYKIRWGVEIQASICIPNGQRIYSDIKSFRVKAKKVAYDIEIWMDHSMGSMFRAFLFDPAYQAMRPLFADGASTGQWTFPDVGPGR